MAKAERGKIVILTAMKRIPRTCYECAYYRPYPDMHGWRANAGYCSAYPNKSTAGIRISRERLEDCPLRENKGEIEC